MATCIACASPYLYANTTNALYSIWNTLPNASAAGAPAGLQQFTQKLHPTVTPLQLPHL